MDLEPPWSAPDADPAGDIRAFMERLLNEELPGWQLKIAQEAAYAVIYGQGVVHETRRDGSRRLYAKGGPNDPSVRERPRLPKVELRGQEPWFAIVDEYAHTRPLRSGWLAFCTEPVSRG